MAPQIIPAIAASEYDVKYNNAGTLYGLFYSYYVATYSNTGLLLRTAYFDAAGNVAARQTFDGAGGWTISLNGSPWRVKTVKADKSYDIRTYASGVFAGVIFASSDDVYDASGVRRSVTVLDAGGAVLASASFSTDGGYQIFRGGVLYQQKTVKADKSYEIRTYVSGSFAGAQFASSDDVYNASGLRQSLTVFDASGAALATASFAADGGYQVFRGGVLFQQKTVNADSSYDIRTYVSGAFAGTNFASSDIAYDAAGARRSLTVFDAGGAVLASASFTTDGGYQILRGGVLYQQKTVKADSSYDIRTYTPGVIAGVQFASSDDVYDASGARRFLAYLDTDGSTVLTATVTAGGSSVLSFGPAYFANLTADGLNALSPPEVAALTASQVSKFKATALAGVTPSFIINLSTLGVSGITADQFHALSAPLLAQFSAQQLRALTNEQIGALKASEIAAFNPSFWSGAAWTGVAANWLAHLQSAAVAVLPLAAFRALTVGSLSAAPGVNWAFLTADQLNALPAADWAEVPVDALSASALARLAPSAIAAIPVAGVPRIPIDKLSSAQAAALTRDQLNALSGGSQTPALSADQIIAICAANNGDFWGQVGIAFLARLSPSAIQALTPFAVSRIPPSTINSLRGFTAYLSASAVQALTPNQLIQLTDTGLTSIRASFFLPGQLGSVDATFVRGLSAAQTFELNAAQVGAIPVGLISNLKVGFLSSDGVAGLSAAQLGALSASTLMAMGQGNVLPFNPVVVPPPAGAFTAFQIKAITDSHLGFWALATAAFIGALTPTAIIGAGVAGLLALPSAAVAALTGDDLATIASADLPNFWPRVPASWLKALSAATLARIPPVVISQLQPFAIAGLTSLADLTDAQLSALTPVQTAQLTTAQIATVSKLDKLSYPEALNLLTLGALKSTDIFRFTPTQFARVNAQWLNALSSEASGAITVAQLQAILPQHIPYLRSSIFRAMSSTLAANLTLEQVVNLTAAQIAALSKAAAQALTLANVASLSLNQLQGVNVAATFTAAQISASSALTAALEQNWTTKDIEGVGIQNLSAQQIAGLSEIQLSSLPYQDLYAFSQTQILQMSTRQLGAIANLLPYNSVVNAEVKYLLASPKKLGQIAAAADISKFGAGTLGDPLIWPNLTREQVVALQPYLALPIGPSAPTALQTNTFNNLIKLSDAAFAGLGEVLFPINTLKGLIFASARLFTPLTTGQIDAIAPQLWQTALDSIEQMRQDAIKAGNSFNALALKVSQDYFTSHAGSSGWKVYHDSLLGPWLYQNPSQVLGFSLKQLAALTDSDVQSLSAPVLGGLTTDQYAALYPRLTQSQVQSLLLQEIGLLPAETQATFFNSNALNADIQALLIPNATSGQLFSGAFTTADQIAAQTIITLYDQNFVQIAASPDRFKELTALYNLVETRSTTLIANSTIAAQITANVNSILNDFTLYNTALTPTAPVVGGSTDVKGYVQTVSDGLNKAVGGITTLLSDLDGLSRIESNVAGLVLDNTTQATPLPALLQWALDGSPNANTPAGAGNLTYNNVGGLTFAQAMEQVELSLFTNADRFVENAAAGIDNVVAKKKFSDQQAVINQVLDIATSVLSFGSGIGKILGTFASEFGGQIITSATKNIAAVVVKQLAEVTGQVSSALSIGQKLNKSFATANAKGHYSNLTSAGGYIGTVVNELTSFLNSGDETAAKAIDKANDFASHYEDLVRRIATTLNKSSDVLSFNTIDQFQAADPTKPQAGYNTNLVDAVANAPVVRRNFQGLLNIPVGDMPTTDILATMKDDNGESHSIGLNLAQLFGHDPTTINPKLQTDSGTKHIFKDNTDFAVQWWSYMTAGPDLPGYAATSVELVLATNDPYAPNKAGLPVQIENVTLWGYNPV